MIGPWRLDLHSVTTVEDWSKNHIKKIECKSCRLKTAHWSLPPQDSEFDFIRFSFLLFILSLCK